MYSHQALFQRECDHCGATAYIFEIFPNGGSKARKQGAETARDNDVLFPVGQITNNASTNSRTGLEFPQFFPARGVKGVNEAFAVTIENEIAGRGEDWAQAGVLIVNTLCMR